MTLVQRPTPAVTMRPTDQMYGAIQNNDDPTRTCRCADPEVRRLVDLIASGLDQFAASRLIWGGSDQWVRHTNEPCSLQPVIEISEEEAAPADLPVRKVSGSERAAGAATPAESSSSEPDTGWSLKRLLGGWWLL